ncbi:MAG TPA: AMP-binding protein, partial [Streptosporangiaceae bacterium]|nr:AMP-binding protein [Streptosporangiaceae bacterium]
MTVPTVTQATGSSLQRLAEQAWDRTAAGSRLYFEGAQWTGEQLAERVRRLSGGLREAGLEPGERVVVCMANCPEVNITYQAVWRAGAVATPVLFLLSEDELRHVLDDSGAAYAVTTPEFLPKVVAAARGINTLRAVIVAGDFAADGAGPQLLSYAQLEDSAAGSLIDSDPGELAALLYTGGTTGRSKGVMISHNALSASS